MTEKKKNMLPSFDLIDDVRDLDEEKEVSSRMAYKQFEMDQENRKGIYLTTDSPVISFELLETAPKGFFDKLQELALEVTAEIINEISATEATIHIINHKNNPTDPQLKETILYIVMSEFSKIDRKNNSVTVLKPTDKDILLAMVINETIGLGPLEPLWNESKVTEIMVNGPKDVQVEIEGNVRRVPSISFKDKDHMKRLIDKLYSSINKQVSPVNPRERGRLHDNSRIYAVHETVAPNGPNFNIRKHAEDYWSPLDIISRGTASPELMEYLGNLIHSGVSFLVVGGTGTGKTTLLNALTGFLPEDERIITLEENLEMKPHPGKLIAAPMECIPARAWDDERKGVTMRDLVRSSLQMRPDGIIIGEVSDGAAYDLCQALNTGHYGASTVHANDSTDAIDRLTSLVSQEEFVRGPAVLDLMGSAFDIMIVVDRIQDGSRKITEVVELGRTPVLAENNQLTLKTIPLWEFEVEEITDNGTSRLEANWTHVNDLSEYRQKKHRLHIQKKMTWSELVELSSYEAEKDETKEGGN